MGLNCSATNYYMGLASGPNARNWSSTWVLRRTGTPGTGTQFIAEFQIDFNTRWVVYLDPADNTVHLSVTEDGGSTGDYNLFTAAVDTNYGMMLWRDHTAGQVKLYYATNPASAWTSSVTHTVTDFVGDIPMTQLRFGNIDDTTLQVFNWKMFTGIVISDADGRDEVRFRNIQHNAGSIFGNWKFLTGALTTDSGGGGNTLTATGSPTFVADVAMVEGDDPGGGGGGTIAAISSGYHLRGMR